jgi:hypothetical protein
MSIYEILPALDLTQSVHAKISIGMHRVIKLKISRIPQVYVVSVVHLAMNGVRTHNFTSLVVVGT